MIKFSQQGVPFTPVEKPGDYQTFVCLGREPNIDPQQEYHEIDLYYVMQFDNVTWRKIETVITKHLGWPSVAEYRRKVLELMLMRHIFAMIGAMEDSRDQKNTDT